MCLCCWRCGEVDQLFAAKKAADAYFVAFLHSLHQSFPIEDSMHRLLDSWQRCELRTGFAIKPGDAA